MRFRAPLVPGSRTLSIGARAIKRLSLIATMMIYWYSPPLRGMEATFVVTIDRARVVRVPTGTEAVIVGNAAIAELILLKQVAMVVVTGMGFGETKLIALDVAGHRLAQSLIRVVGGRNGLRARRGMSRQFYACARQRLSIVKPGNDAEHNDAEYFKEVAKQLNYCDAQANGLR